MSTWEGIGLTVLVFVLFIFGRSGIVSTILWLKRQDRIEQDKASRKDDKPQP